MQQGMLFHTLFAPQSGMYFQQWNCKLHGKLNPDVLKRAWQKVVDRHPVLRTSFVWHDLKEPVQVVRLSVSLPWLSLDWRSSSPLEQQRLLDDFLAADLQRGFDLQQPPLLRLALIRIADETYHFVWSFHHLLLDGWSTPLVIKEVFTFYEAFSGGREVELAGVRPYREYIGWLRQQELGAAEAFWREMLKGFSAPTTLGIERGEKAAADDSEATAQYEGQEVSLTAEETRGLQQLAREQQVTLNTVVQGAWAVLLGRYSGSEDVVFGATVSGRPATLPGVEEMVGLFINTLPVRVRMERGEGVGESLRRLQGQQVEVRQYEYSPLVEVQGWSEVAKGTPLFETLMVFENTPLEETHSERDGGLQVSEVHYIERNNYSLTVVVIPGRNLSLEVWYDGRHYDAATTKRILEHLRTLLASMVANPEQPVSHLPLLTPSEREQLLFDWNHTPFDFPLSRCIHQLFEAQARRSPDALALSCSASSSMLSYAELDLRSNQLAHYLRRSAVTTGSVVALLLDHSVETLIAILGVLKAGAAYLPLDAAHPPARLAFALSDANAALVLTQQALMERLSPALTAHLPADTVLPPIFSLDTEWEVCAALPTDNPSSSEQSSEQSSASLAYLIYTSGSTGQPKAVMIQHRSLVNYICWAKEVYLPEGEDSAEESSFALYSSLAFDLTVTSLFVPLVSGQTLSIYPKQGPESPLLSVLEENRTQVLKLTPSHLSLLKELDNRHSRIKRLIVGGEALSTELARAVSESFAHEVEIYNEYGPTEATVGCMLYRFDPQTDDRAWVAIGRPAANTQVYLLDEQLAAVAENVTAELYIGGEGVALGYLDRPELTAQKFIADPYGRRAGARLYRTGDLARRLVTGEVEYLGRRDEQVKYHGHRVELQELRSALVMHPQVRDAVVVVRRDGQGREQLVGYYVSRQAIESGELREQMRERVIVETVPTQFVHLRRLPLTLNGKVNVEALPVAGEDNSRGGVGEGVRVEPRTEEEGKLVEIWREVLGRERVGIHDNFFELGGDSILSIQIIARANRAGLALMPKQLFQHPTVAGLAAVAGQRPAVESEQGMVAGEVVLTPIQQWFFEQELARPEHYNQSLLLRVKKPVELSVLRAVVGELLRQHDGLRLRFERGGEGGWRQWHGAWSEELVEQSCRELDLSGVEQSERSGAITAACEEVQRSLELKRGPLFRVLWIKTGEAGSEGGGGRLLVVAHHLVVDGVSWRILLEDLERGTEQAGRGEPIKLGEKTTSYRRWAEELARVAAGGLGAGEAEYWEGVGQRAVQEIPEGRAGGANEEGSAASVSVRLSEERTRELLEEVPGAYHTQINDVLLTALALAFTRWNGISELLINLEGHGREEIGDEVNVSRTVGWFTSIYPVRLENKFGNDEPGELLKHIKESLRRIPRRGIGYGLLRYLSAETAVTKRLRALPQPQVSFNYFGQLDHVIDAAGWLEAATELTGAERDEGYQRPHLLDINASVIEDRLGVRWTYSTNIHERSVIEGVAKNFIDAIEELIEHCLTPGVGGYTPSDFQLIHIEQQQLDRLLGAERGVEDVYPLSSTQQGILFHTLYEPDLREYCIQLKCTLHGALNNTAFKRAWHEVINRHSILRTSFVWHDLKEPVQVVRLSVSLPWLSLDWRSSSPLEQQRLLDDFLAADLQRGFDLQQPPLLRLALIRIADETYHFVWSFHHLLLDGWSTPLVIKEVFTFYEAFSGGREVELAGVRPYREYIGWLRQQELGAAEAFWREMLRGFSAPTTLGIERGEKAAADDSEATAQYEGQEVRLTAEETRGLQQLAREQQVTLNTVVQGAWAVLLGRYSGSEDVVFGATVSGRPATLPGVEEMVGLFINTLPVRVRMERGEGVGESLRRLQGQQVEVRQYEYSPLVEVQGWSEVAKGTPLFETLLVFENYPVGEALEESSGGLEISDVRNIERNSYPLSLIVVPGQELVLEIIHNSKRYEAESMVRLMGHLQVILQEMAMRPDGTLSSLQMLTDAETQQLLFDWNGNRSAYPQERCLHQLFEARVELAPEAVAVIYEEESLTYRELNVRANQLAHSLQRLGVGPERIVAICVERSLEMIVAQLGVLKAGGAYVPIDPSYPPERQALICEDINAAVLLTQERILKAFPETGAQVICLDSDWEAIAEESESNPLSQAVVANAAYVIYTSGSTGKPKGIIVTHANVLRLFAATQSWARFDESDVWTLFHSYAFDFSVWEMWGALFYGGRLVVVPFWVSRSPEAFYHLLIDAQVTVLNQTPSAFRQLMLVEETLSRTEELSLRLIVFGGEALELQSLKPWFARHDEQQTQLVNMYGITETTVHVTYHLVTQSDLANYQGSVIGVPISDLQVYLLDERLLPVPVGVAGEIYVGGPAVARGYLGRVELTAERFIPHPFSQQPGERLYRSGDLGRYMANGEIEYLGRIDHQVKVRGFRIEVGEIESVLSAHPAVRECVVVARKDFSGDKRLVAYVVGAAGMAVNVRELRAFTKEKLPEYMIPSSVVILESLPLTPSGKVDRNALPSPQTALVEPRTTFEEQLLLDAPPLTPAERHKILYEWNNTRVERSQEQYIHELIEGQAERTPAAIAVVFDDERLTYGELNARANQLAHYLRRQGVGVEQVVGVLMERSLEMVVALLGILKAGAAYLPLDPTYPQERLGYMLSDGGVRVVLTQGPVWREKESELGAAVEQVVRVEEQWAEVAGESRERVESGVRGENLAYVIYTSGSTGNPKGAMNTHRAIHNRLLWMQEAYHLTSDDCVLQKTPFSFDVSVWEFFWPLMTGSRLVMAIPNGHLDSAYLIELIRSEQITTLHFVPSMLQAFLEETGVGRCQSLRRVVCSGETLSVGLQQRFFERVENCELHNLYGPTEAAVDVTSWQCRIEDESRTVPIGKPIANLRIYLLDSRQQPVPVGVVGELHIAGMGLGRGYLQRPELTAERFIPDSLGGEAGSRLYRSGDLARYMGDGNIEFLGRVDHQVKVRGVRIELGEIEGALNEHPGIRASVVVVQADHRGEKRLVAYVVGEEKVASSELRRYLRERLPESMIPQGFVQMERLPLTSSGKIDRRGLPERKAIGEATAEYEAPRNEVEGEIASIWGSVLGVERVGIHDNFFELGGDSILSIQIIARANRAGLALMPKQLFQHPTVAGLAAVAGQRPAVESEQGMVAGEVVLTPIQQWFFEQELARPEHYNQSLLLRVKKPVELSVLRAVVGELLRQHDGLRLRFERGGEGGWRQWHGAWSEELVEQSCRELDLSGVEQSERSGAITAACEEVQRSLELKRGPLFRVLWIKTGEAGSEGGGGRLLVVAHHLVVDGVSWRILLEDLERGTEQAGRGEPIKLGEKTTSYRRWAEELARVAAGGLGAGEAEYWEGVGQRAVQEIPEGRAGGANEEGSAASVSVRLSEERTRELLEEVPGAYHTQINDVLLTALARTLSWWSGAVEQATGSKATAKSEAMSSGVLVELEGHGREEIGDEVNVSRTVGWFTSIYPVVLGGSREEEVGAALKRIKEQLRGVPRRGLGYGLLRYLGAEEQREKLARGKRAEVGFNYLGQVDQVVGGERWVEVSEESWGAEREASGRRVHEVEVSGQVVGGELRMRWEYSGERYGREEMEAVARRYEEELEELIEHCVRGEGGGFTPSDFPLADTGEAELEKAFAAVEFEERQI